jgi:hypothetical protein
MSISDRESWQDCVEREEKELYRSGYDHDQAGQIAADE